MFQHPLNRRKQPMGGQHSGGRSDESSLDALRRPPAGHFASIDVFVLQCDVASSTLRDPFLLVGSDQQKTFPE